MSLQHDLLTACLPGSHPSMQYSERHLITPYFVFGLGVRNCVPPPMRCADASLTYCPHPQSGFMDNFKVFLLTYISVTHSHHSVDILINRYVKVSAGCSSVDL